MTNHINAAPRLLNDQCLDDLNREMLRNNHTFVFLGPREKLLSRTPSCWAEAFELYTTGLYKVYHEYGAAFLDCYINETIKSNNDFSFKKHINFVKNCRSAIQHSGDSGNRTWAFNTLLNYVFRSNYMDFGFSDWDNFWENASEAHWEAITRAIIKDSDQLLEYLKKIASRDASCQGVCQAVANDFRNGNYTPGTNRNPINIYDISLNARLFGLIMHQLEKENAFSKYDDDDDSKSAKDELISLKQVKNGESTDDALSEAEQQAGVKTPLQIKTAIIDDLILAINSSDKEESKSSILSESVYEYILASTESKIKSQLKARKEAEYIDSAILI